MEKNRLMKDEKCVERFLTNLNTEKNNSGPKHENLANNLVLSAMDKL